MGWNLKSHGLWPCPSNDIQITISYFMRITNKIFRLWYLLVLYILGWNFKSHGLWPWPSNDLQITISYIMCVINKIFFWYLLGCKFCLKKLFRSICSDWCWPNVKFRDIRVSQNEKLVFGLCKNGEKNIWPLNHFSGKNFLSKKIIQINMQCLSLAKCEISRY